MKEITFYQMMFVLLLVSLLVSTFSRESDYNTFEFNNEMNLTIEKMYLFNQSRCDCPKSLIYVFKKNVTILNYTDGIRVIK